MQDRKTQKASTGDDGVIFQAGRDIKISTGGNIPTALVDERIEEEVVNLRKSRFFSEFQKTRASLTLGSRLTEEGDLEGGSREVRGKALSWCARLLSVSGELEQAEEFLGLAKILADSPEAEIAEAFIISQKGDKPKALRALASINSQASRSASLMIVFHHDGSKTALNWLDNAGYTVEDLDSDGKAFLLNHQLHMGRWDEAAQTLELLFEVDFSETPILYQLAGLATLIPTIPEDFRAIVLSQVPFELSEFPLASDDVSKDARRSARQYFLKAVDIAKDFSCLYAARMADDYALWLELRDPDLTEYGRERLKDKLRNSETRLGVINYALQFGVKLDMQLVEEDIRRDIAKNAGMTGDAAIARFSLAFTNKTASETADYIARYQDQLADHINPKLMQFRLIELFAKANLVEKAHSVLSDLIEQGITDEEENNLRRIISALAGDDQIGLCKERFKETGRLDDLINLVAELERRQHWDEACQFGKLLFDRTQDLQNALRLVDAFNRNQKSEELVRFLEDNNYLLSQSSHLYMSYAWGLYQEGEFVRSRAALNDLNEESDSQNYRALWMNLGIAMGDETALSSYILSEYQNREDRSAQELLRAAQLAFYLDSPHAKDLLVEATTKAQDDPSVLASAYFLATNSGWEEDLECHGWLQKAAQLSGDDGPIQKMSLEDIFARKPDWDRRESETLSMFEQGKVPIFLGAQSLNRTLVDLTVFPALVNLDQVDPRRRSIIPAYSGKRSPLEVEVTGRVVALDATALLTLSFLKIFDTTLDTLDTVYIPHSTLGWLFEERQRAAFHQPSRIDEARKVHELIAEENLEKFIPTTIACSDLSAQVGDELAALIAEAERVRDQEDVQCIVVRPAPVHRLSSLMKEEADLSEHSSVLSGCLAVVEKLKEKGRVSAEEERQARAYLQLQERPWPNQPDIADGARLYLDGLAVTYLLHLGMLGKLKPAGLRAVVSPREVSEIDALISYQRISGEVKKIIDRIREGLSQRIEAGRVKVGRKYNFAESEGKSTLEHPSAEILGLAPDCDFAVIDDRFLNRHANISSDSTQAPVLTTLDMLDALLAKGVLSNEAFIENRKQLRRAGYALVPVAAGELEQCLKETGVAHGEVIETAELRAIRESFVRVRMSDSLSLPEESVWLDGMLKVFIQVLRNLWVDGVDFEEAAARSNWLARQIDIRGWAHSLLPENSENVVQAAREAYIFLLLMPPTNVEQNVVNAYWSWFEDQVLVPVQEHFPELYERLVGRSRNYFAEMMDTQLSEGDDL